MYWKGSPGEGEESCQSICIRDYADSKNDLVINHAIGTTFDMLHEAYDFYSLYSWEHGFGIRYAKSRLNVQRTKCMQEIVCGCAVRHLLIFAFQVNQFVSVSGLVLLYSLTMPTSGKRQGKHLADNIFDAFTQKNFKGKHMCYMLIFAIPT